MLGEHSWLHALVRESRAALFGRLGLPDAPTGTSFTTSRLDHRNDQFDAAQHSQVAARLGWAAEARVARLDAYAHSPISIPFYEDRMGYKRRSVLFQKQL